jgi:hypothetical protein
VADGTRETDQIIYISLYIKISNVFSILIRVMQPLIDLKWLY